MYISTLPVIYSVEQVPLLGSAVDTRLSTPGIVTVASDLTRLECRVKPIRTGDAALLHDFDDYFTSAVSEILGLSRAVMDRATDIRAQYLFKTADAIHLAVAVVSAYDVFLTNDHRLDRFPDLTVEVVQP